MIIFLSFYILAVSPEKVFSASYPPLKARSLALSERNVATTDATAGKMFDQIAKFASGNPQATYASTTSTNFQDLFTCTNGDASLENAQDAAWSGFIEYAKQSANVILVDDGTGQTIEVVDEWGGRCPEGLDGCGERYSECASAESCTPQLLEYPFEDEGTVLGIDIYEPCNFASNLAYYRVIPQLCGPHLNMDAETSDAYMQAFAALGFGSSVWHGSHTYLGNRADVILIEIVALLVHQMIVNALDSASPGVANVEQLRELSPVPRAKTAISLASEVTSMFQDLHVIDWTQTLVALDSPDYELTFAVIIAAALSIIFPERDDTVAGIITAATGIMGIDPTELNSVYVPILRELSSNLNLSKEEKFVLFRQFVGVMGKLIFAFLWQEQVIPIPFFLAPGPNSIAAQIMAPLLSMYNFISGFVHTDSAFQSFQGMYPGDESCRSTEPHAKWHEISANGLLDMVYMSDCVVAVVSGQDSQGCAQLANLDGLGTITRTSLEAWFDNEIRIPTPLVKDIVPWFFSECFFAFDSNRDDKIDMTDIEYYVDKVVDWVHEVQAFIESFQGIVSLFDTINCISDSQCSGSQECIFLSCGKQSDGDLCVVDSDCVSGQCAFFTCGIQNNGDPCFLNSDCDSGRCDWVGLIRECRAKKADGSTCNEASDCVSNRCIFGTCGLQADGEICSADNQCQNPPCNLGTCGDNRANGVICAFDSDCASGRCELVGLVRECRAKKANGENCNEDSDCQSGRCDGFIGSATCKNKLGRGHWCLEDSDCRNGDCRWTWTGLKCN